tara:strand:+ start:192 stop:365 length:174 start_codon:yes stop_codon:yes gene_type:complete
MRAIVDIENPDIGKKNCLTSQRNHYRSKPQQCFNPPTSLKKQEKITSAPLLGRLSIY